MERTLRIAALPLLLACACAQARNSLTATSDRPGHTRERVPWDAPPLEHAVSVRDGRTGERMTFDALLDRLAKADAVFLGETHTDETTHAVELAAYEGLALRRESRVVLALEFFERDVQPALDAYIAGEIDERTFLARARPWSNYATAYRPMIEHARAHRLPVLASNFPAPLRRRLGGAENAGLDALSAEERELAPRELLANTPAYWRRVDNAVRGHLDMMGPRPAADDPRLTSAQSLWDNSMGETCARALEQHPDHLVLHMNGGFHSAYWDGTVRQLALRKPDAKIATVSIVPTTNPNVAETDGVPIADFVVFAEQRATDVNDGRYGVYVTKKLEYALHLPPAVSAVSASTATPSAAASARVPLLVWLADDGATVEDELALWKARIGDAAAIAVVEAPYRQIEDDLVPGARWYWPNSFDEDIGLAAHGVDRVASFLLRHHPIDPERVVLAGEGTGATLAAITAVGGTSCTVRAVALQPRRYDKVKDIPLPLPELRGDSHAPRNTVQVVVDAAGEEYWRSETEQYASVGLAATLARVSDDPWRVELDLENRVRAALALAPRELPANAARAHIVADSPRARAWARLLAAKSADGRAVAIVDASAAPGDSVEITPAVRPDDFRADKQLPRCPGPFGGTTIVVVPESADASELEAWLALEKDDPIAKKSRFHRLRIATASAERALPTVLQQVLDRGGKNVLIVPASACADGETMRALAHGARGFEDRMTLNWRPGLGGS
ncbi:MAG: ChaN family lipoprotein [Planctomycetota bacterium]